MVEVPPAIGRVPATISVSSTSQRSASSSISSLGTSPDKTCTGGSLRIVIPTTDVEEAADEMEEINVPVSPPRLPMRQNPMASSMMQAVTSSVIYARQMEDEAAASPPRGPETRCLGWRLQEQRGPYCPLAVDHRGTQSDDNGGARPRTNFETPTEPSHLGWMQPRTVPRWDCMETEMWEEVEEAAQLSVQGTREGAIDYALAVLSQACTDIEERFQCQSRALQASRQKCDDFGHLEHVRRLMGWMHHLWK